ncbi:MAG TPA: reverse transcriptase-like protein [Candidatus Acidoferrales bacterium]|nr:reverse transcriptase-like protein [Candidatus Acidoferrales bacterium]
MTRPETPASRSAGLFSEPATNASQRGLITANIDGGARGNPGPAAYGIVLREAGGATLIATGKYVGRTTNNVAEYYGLIAALDAARERGVSRLRVESDSELLVRQMQGRYRVKSPDLKPLHERAVKLSRGFEYFDIAHIPREKNQEADRLVNAALDGKDENRNSKNDNRGEKSAGQPAQTENPAARTIRAHYREGVLVPEAALDLPEGAEVVLTVKPAAPKRN